MNQHRNLEQKLQAALSEPKFQSVRQEHEQRRARFDVNQAEQYLRREAASNLPKRDLTQSQSGNLEVANCNSILYTTNIELGGQQFPVVIDSGSSDLWIQSSKCDETCRTNKGYVQSKSVTYKSAEADKLDFEIKYLDGTKVVGEHGYETLKLGDVIVEHQVFAQATSMYNTTTVCDEMGVLGLGFSDISSHNFPALLSNLKSTLEYPVFSLYLDAHNDYELQMNQTLHSEQPIKGHAPVSYSSEITFGGVNATRYSGCLQWHALGQFRAKGEVFQGFWDFELEKVLVGEEEIPTSKLAMIDSGSTIVVGSRESVGHITKQLGMECFVLVDTVIGIEAEAVECDNPFGFDMAVTSCVGTLDPIVFQADGTQYKLETADLLREIDTALGPVCILDLIGVPAFPGWLLGMNFMHEYYTVFDFGSRKLGFAKASQYDESVCQADAYLNIKTPTPAPASNTSHAINEIAAPQLPETGSAPSRATTTPSPGTFGIFAAVLIVVAMVSFWFGNRRNQQRSYRYEPTDGIQMCTSTETESTDSSDVEL